MVKSKAKEYEAKYHDLWYEVNRLNREISEKRKAGKGVTRLARKMKKIEDEATRYRTLASITAREEAKEKKKGGRTTRRKKLSSRKNVPK